MRFNRIIYIIFLFHISRSTCISQCVGLDADAGPDLFTCDPNIMVQLNGSVQGTYKKFMWAPSVGLSNAQVLDPMFTLKTPGIYKFKLIAEGLSSNNLVVNGDFEFVNTGFTSGYIYGFPGFFGYGYYGVGTNPNLYWSGFTSCGDHTTGSSNMLIVDGSQTAGTNVWCQTIPVTIGKAYQFEFYVQSIYPPSPCQLNMTMNGVSFGNITGGAVCEWLKFEGCFTATSASAKICISEMSGVASGNDFAIDDIALYEKCIDEDEVIVEIVDLKAVLNIPIRPKCSSEVFDLAGIGSSTGPKIRYEWSTDIGKIISQNGFNAKAKGSGTYTLKVIYTNGTVICEKEVSIDYMAPDELFGELKGVGISNCRLDTINLDANVLTGSGDYAYRWSPDSLILIGQNTDHVKVIQSGTYNVTVTDKTTGCELILDYEVIQDTLHPIASVQGDTLIDCTKNAVALNSLLTDTSRYQVIWTKPDQTQVKDSVKIKSNLSGKYTLTVIDKKNYCQDTRDWNVTVDSLFPQIDLGTDLVIDCKNNGVNIIPTETSQTGMF
ncbi:MAG: hypothetical protein WBO76_13435, partial [Saprospiraceae bacterium]